MSDLKKIILVGYSGHSLVVADTAIINGYDVIGYLEQEEKKENPLNIIHFGNDNEIINRESVYYFPTIGDNRVRKKIISLIQNKNIDQINLIHPSAVISNFWKIGKSNFIASNVSINAFAQIGNGCILNTNSIIEHECIIEDFCHIAPGCTLAGNVTIGSCSFIGANSVIKQGVKIGQNVTIGAGAVVLKDVPDNEVWVGNPAKKIKY